MKSILLFAAKHYNEHGGIDDFKGDFDTIEDILAWLEENMKETYGWADIVSYETLERIDLYKNDENGKGWFKGHEDDEYI